LPRNVTSVNRGGTPSPALFLCAIVSITLVVSGSFDTLIGIGSILFAVDPWAETTRTVTKYRSMKLR